MSTVTTHAEAINLVDIAAHPSEALAALIQVVQSQGETIRMHEWRLNKLSDFIRELQARSEPEPQPLQKDRGDILRAILAANGGKMLAKDARHKMNTDKATFSRLLTKMKAYIEVKPLHTNRSQNLLVLKSENG